jgi:small-conductance mechanosensitive channel
MQAAQANGGAERWVTIAEAADAFGVSIDTVRRRVKRDEVAHRQTRTPAGFRYEVRLDGLRRPDAEVGSRVGAASTQAAQALEAGHLAQLVRDFQAEALRQTQAAAMWQARAEFLASQLEEAHQQVRALEAPKPAESVPTHAAEVVAPPGQEPKRPWWRFW